ncbi:hypothetical protein BASA61_003437 [Batrachochytrium salamandrivorans]|nr:hypothetical protein BASA61_003437 [Batrachochytrium salamandrivorans]
MLAAQEFQAVILAGFGSRLYPLADGDTVPKALLPVANRPMIAYQLEWLEEANIRDIIIAAYPGARGKINGVVQSMYEGSTEARVQIVEVPENCGSADALRSIKSRIKVEESHNDCLFYDAGNLEANSDRPVSKDDGLGEFIGIDDQSSRLLIMASKADLDDCLELRTSLIEKFPVIHIHSQLRDAHLYIFRRWVIDLVVKDRNISILSTNLDLFGRAMLYSTSGHEPTPHNVTCNAVVYRDGFTARGNTIWSYSELNRHVIKNSTDVRVQASSEVSAKTQVGQDSLVGEGSKIDERCSVKKICDWQPLHYRQKRQAHQ